MAEKKNKRRKKEKKKTMLLETHRDFIFNTFDIVKKIPMRRFKPHFKRLLNDSNPKITLNYFNNKLTPNKL